MKIFLNTLSLQAEQLILSGEKEDVAVIDDLKEELLICRCSFFFAIEEFYDDFVSIKDGRRQQDHSVLLVLNETRNSIRGLVSQGHHKAGEVVHLHSV